MAKAREIPVLGEVYSINNAYFEDESAEFKDMQEIPQHIPVIKIIDPRKEHPVGMVSDMTIKVRCPEGCDLRGGTILIGDANDQVVAEQTLTGYNERNGVNTTGNFFVEMPKEAGDHTWTIVFYPSECHTIDYDSNLSNSGSTDQNDFEEIEAAQHAIVQAEYHFNAEQHITGMSVWRDSLEPVPMGDEYLLNVGINCMLGCSLLGQTVRIYHDGILLASAVMEEPSAPLESLYRAKVQLTAPQEVGRFTLECRFEPEELDVSHTSNILKYTLTTNKHAQCRLDLIALNEKDGMPLSYADFIVRPKDGFAGYIRSGEDGKASIGMPWGDITVEAICDEYRDASASITVPENQEVYELTLAMAWEPRRLD